MLDKPNYAPPVAPVQFLRKATHTVVSSITWSVVKRGRDRGEGGGGGMIFVFLHA